MPRRCAGVNCVMNPDSMLVSVSYIILWYIIMRVLYSYFFFNYTEQKPDCSTSSNISSMSTFSSATDTTPSVVKLSIKSNSKQNISHSNLNDDLKGIRISQVSRKRNVVYMTTGKTHGPAIIVYPAAPKEHVYQARTGLPH